ncbi:hypothetical protein PanWU01x14_233500 [Parasponia andersonii]|uniref:Uncharacterized protein n=1 Tax=Parasponia andersonii TaxID=3476 RepID=A0A2P5BJI2_PARAD|nr:hypothetical protein PanWU01x14_233500 [Parasponia andersonii]
MAKEIGLNNILGIQKCKVSQEENANLIAIHETTPKKVKAKCYDESTYTMKEINDIRKERNA